MMKKGFLKTFAATLALVMLTSAAGCTPSATPPDGPGGTVGSDGDPSASVVKFAYAEDKIYQSYDREVNGVVDTALYEQGQEYMAKLLDDFSITAFRNETESRQMIITASADVAAYDLTVSDFKKGNDVLPASCIEIAHEYYHNLSSVMDKQTPMSAGMVPDAIIPLEYAKLNGLNKIKANENQGIYITVNVPKTQPAGEYSGTFELKLDGAVKKYNGKITVLDYTLPDEAVARSCMVVNGMPTDNLQYLELDSSQEMYWKYVEALGEFRLSAQYMYGAKTDTTSADDARVYAQEHVKYMLKAAKNPKINTYSIRTNGKWALVEGFDKQKVTLNEEYFMIYTKAMVEATLKEGVDLFKKATVYMGSIIDEPEDTVGAGIVDYVCEQFHSCQRKTVEYLNQIKDSAERAANVDDAFIEQVIASILDMTNVVTTSAEPDSFTQIDSYCPKIATPGGLKYPEPVGSSAKLENYAEASKQTTSNGRNKDFWWYTHQTPYYPNPTLHIDDNGVSARVMYWMMSEYNIKGYLIWETVMTQTPEGQLYGWDLYDNVIRDNVSAGDAFMFYPGKLLGMDTPVPCVRLYYMRDGIEDYDAMYDLRNNLYGNLSKQYSADVDVDGILNEIYAAMYTLNRTYATTADLAKARSGLESLLVWANSGIGVSDFCLKADGTVNAKIYAPQSKTITLNGTALTGGKVSGEGVVYEINEKMNAFVLSAEGMSVSVDTGVSSIFTAETSKFTVYAVDGGRETVVQNAALEISGGNAVISVKSNYSEIDYTLSASDITPETKSLMIVIYYEGSEKTKLTVGIKSALLRGTLDTVYLHPGENVIRIDRLNDLDWYALEEIKKITLIPESERGEYKITVKGISVI